jgi:hypothetical protein
VFNATFSNISAISWRPVLVVEEAGVTGVQNYKRFSYTGAPLSNTLWPRRANKDVNKIHWTALSKSNIIMYIVGKYIIYLYEL